MSKYKRDPDSGFRFDKNKESYFSMCVDIGISKDGVVSVHEYDTEAKEQSKKLKRPKGSPFNVKTRSFNHSFLLLSDSETAVSDTENRENFKGKF